MLDLEYKQSLVELGLTEISILESKMMYFQKYYSNSKNNEINEIRERINFLKSQIDFTFDDLVNADKLVLSWHQKHKRLRSRIDTMIEFSNNVYFGTFTLNNDYINLKKETLEKYLKRVLKSHCNIYVANADYGKGNGRLHFHAVLTCHDIKALENAWSYGFTKFLKVATREDSSIKMAKYITKLTNHALKDTTKPLENKLIYSRNVAQGCFNELTQ